MEVHRALLRSRHHRPNGRPRKDPVEGPVDVRIFLTNSRARPSAAPALAAGGRSTTILAAQRRPRGALGSKQDSATGGRRRSLNGRAGSDTLAASTRCALVLSTGPGGEGTWAALAVGIVEIHAVSVRAAFA
jgi:hypothetical protein